MQWFRATSKSAAAALAAPAPRASLAVCCPGPGTTRIAVSPSLPTRPTVPHVSVHSYRAAPRASIRSPCTARGRTQPEAGSVSAWVSHAAQQGRPAGAGTAGVSQVSGRGGGKSAGPWLEEKSAGLEFLAYVSFLTITSNAWGSHLNFLRLQSSSTLLR